MAEKRQNGTQFFGFQIGRFWRFLFNSNRFRIFAKRKSRDKKASEKYRRRSKTNVKSGERSSQRRHNDLKEGRAQHQLRRGEVHQSKQIQDGQNWKFPSCNTRCQQQQQQKAKPSATIAATKTDQFFEKEAVRAGEPEREPQRGGCGGLEHYSATCRPKWSKTFRTEHLEADPAGRNDQIRTFQDKLLREL